MPSKDKVLGKIFGDPQKKIIHRLQKRVDEINDLKTVGELFNLILNKIA